MVLLGLMGLNCLKAEERKKEEEKRKKKSKKRVMVILTRFQGWRLQVQQRTFYPTHLRLKRSTEGGVIEGVVVERLMG